MARWAPNARDRLTTAALDLFREQGFAATTVPQITERAGLTTRTFYRHFADKREVLFGHDARAQAQTVLEQAPPGLSTAEFVAWGLRVMATRFEGLREDMRLIQELIDADPGLQERALRKRELLNLIVRDALRDRGLSEQRSRLLADTTVSALYIALDQWLAGDGGVQIDALAVELLASLRADLDGIETA